MGSKLVPQGGFPRNPYRLPAVRGQVLYLANIWNWAESRPLRGHAGGQDVTQFGSSEVRSPRRS